MKKIALGLLLSFINSTHTFAATLDFNDDAGRYSSRAKVDTRLLKGDTYKTVTGRLQVESTLEAALALVRDTDRLTDWVYSCKQVDVITDFAPNKALVHMRFDAPLTLSDRDGYVLFKGAMNDEEDQVLLTLVGEDGHATSSDGAVRMTDIRGKLLFKQVGENKLNILFELHNNPDVRPVFTANLNTRHIVRNTLKNARDILEAETGQLAINEDYRQALLRSE